MGYSANGSYISSYTKRPSGSGYARTSSSQYYPGSSSTRYRHHGSGSRNESYGSRGSRPYYPNSKRYVDQSRNTKFSNFSGAYPSIGGPHSAYSRNTEELINHNVPSGSQYAYTRTGGGGTIRSERTARRSQTHRHSGQISRVSNEYVSPHHGHYDHQQHHHHHHDRSDYLNEAGNQDEEDMRYAPDVRTLYLGVDQGGYLASSSVEEHAPLLHKPHSFNHMLHKQEKALGGKVLAEMHVDHVRDPDPENENMDTAKGEKGHRAHHATIAIVKYEKIPPVVLDGNDYRKFY